MTQIFHNMIAAILGISEKQIGQTLSLLNDGATIPFISRYRKEMTGGLDEVQIEAIQTHYEKLNETAKRKETIINTIQEQGKMTPELQKRIEETWDGTVLEDIYLPYKPCKFLDFDSDAPNRAELVNNYDWMKGFSFLDFAREVGKHITVNYMMAKDSVKKRLNGEARDGLSFTEFTYQLLQGYDFLHLYETKGCKLQMGGSDQWGNITTGAELIRRTNGGEVFALTSPLITKADGGKFGKTESGNIWLDPRYTSPYKFYQFWLNVSDADAARYIKIFTSLSKEEIEALTAEHETAPHLRVLQKRLAKEVTIMVHSEEDYNAAVDASNILFGNATSEALKKLDEDTLLAVFEGVPQFEVSRDALTAGVKAVDLFVDNAAVFASKGEMRKLVQGGGISLNKEKLVAFDQVVTTADLLDDKYLLVQRGKKNYYLIIAK